MHDQKQQQQQQNLMKDNNHANQSQHRANRKVRICNVAGANRSIKSKTPKGKAYNM